MGTHPESVQSEPVQSEHEAEKLLSQEQPTIESKAASTAKTESPDTVAGSQDQPLKSEIVVEGLPGTSIYDLHSSRKAFFLLCLAAFGCLQMPLADTVYFPSLYIIAEDFQTTNGIVALTIALFMLFVGIASLFWGPAADRYGRKKIFLAAAFLYTISNIICYFAPNIIVLIVFRALQGAAVSAFLLGSVIIMDIYPLNKRGAALGLFNIPMFIGPIVGPVVGGALAQVFGWRSTFILLIGVAVVVAVLMIVFLPETHHWYVLQKVKKLNKDVAIVETVVIEANPPVFMSPWKTLLLAFRKSTASYLAVSCIEFGAFYGSLTLFSPVMARPPYSYDQVTIGLLYIPMGVGAMLASIYGGRITDWSGERYKTVPEGRMYASLIFTAITFPPGILIYGWCLEYRTHVAAILVSMFIMGFGCMVYFPSVMAYVGGINQSEAAAASAAMFCTVLVSAGVCSEVVVYIAEGIDFGPMSCLFLAIWLGPTILSWCLIHRKISDSQKEPVKQEMGISAA